MEEESVRKVLKEEFDKRKNFIEAKQAFYKKKDSMFNHNPKKSGFRFFLLFLMVVAIIFAFIKIFF